MSPPPETADSPKVEADVSLGESQGKGEAAATLNAQLSGSEIEILAGLARARRLASDLDLLTTKLKAGRSAMEIEVIDEILATPKVQMSVSASVSSKFQLIWSNIQSVLQSGTFYFFAGLSLLWYSIHASETQLHPSITFLLAMLGVAILLFGTGSQSVGTISNLTQGVGDKESSVKNSASNLSPIGVQAAVAGGAAVLTLIFGFGVIHFSDKIPGVFSDYDKYWNITIVPCKSLVPSCDNNKLDVPAPATSASGPAPLRLSDYRFHITNANGQPIYLAQDEGALRLVVFKSDLAGSDFVTLSANHFDDSTTITPGTVIPDAPSGTAAPKDYEEQFDIELPVERPPDSQGSAGTSTPSCREYIHSVKVECRLSPQEYNVESRADRFGRVEYRLNFGKLSGAVYANPKGDSIEAK